MNFDWFYSDPHFGHQKIIEYCDRPFEDTVMMECELIDNFNSVVGEYDTVLWLGDCFFHHDLDAAQILDSMNGNHFLVCGNHDKKSRRMVNIGFQFAVKQLVWKQCGLTLRASHFPWRGKFNDGRDYLDKWCPKYNKHEVLVHGHTHDTKKHDGGNMIHCGVDAWSYYPVPFSAVLEIAEKNGVTPAL